MSEVRGWKMQIVVYQKRKRGSLATENWRRDGSSVGHMCFETSTSRSCGFGRIGLIFMTGVSLYVATHPVSRVSWEVEMVNTMAHQKRKQFQFGYGELEKVHGEHGSNVC